MFIYDLDTSFRITAIAYNVCFSRWIYLSYLSLVYIISVKGKGTYLLTPVPHLLLALCVSVCLSVPLSLCLFLCLDVCVSVRLHECLPFSRCIMGSLSLFLSSLRRAWCPRKKKCGYFALVRTFPRSNECISPYQAPRPRCGTSVCICWPGEGPR